MKKATAMTHPLAYEWTFWFYHRPAGKQAATVNYADHMKHIDDFGSVCCVATRVTTRVACGGSMSTY